MTTKKKAKADHDALLERPVPEPVEAARAKGLPDGFEPHSGGEPPVGPDDRVVLVIRTSEGLAFDGPVKARLHVWEHEAHEDGLGAVVGWRRATLEDENAIDKYVRWDE